MRIVADQPLRRRADVFRQDTYGCAERQTPGRGGALRTPAEACYAVGVMAVSEIVGTRRVPPASGHVLHVVDEDALPRFGLMIAQCTQVLAALGLRVSVLSDQAWVDEAFIETPVQTIRIPALGGWRAWRAERVLSARLNPPPDLVHVWGTSPLGVIERWRANTDMPLVIHLLGMTDAERLARRGLRGNESVVALSAALLAPLLERSPLAAGVATTIAPAIALPIHATRPPDPTRTLGLMCVTSLTPECRMDVLVDAIAQHRRDHPDFQVMVVGRGPGVSAAWEQIRARDVRDCVSVINEPQLWEKVINDVDVCVVPQCEREFWLAPLMAMGLGKVVLAARDQLGEWFVDQRTCWQFTPGSAVELAYLLGRVVEQPKHVEALSSSSAEHVRQRHTVSEMISGLCGVYHQACPTRFPDQPYDQREEVHDAGSE